MNTSQIKCFLMAAECLNFTKAAERLFLSQSGLSRQIASMEHEFGIELFERGRNSIRLTQAGTIFATYLTKMKYDYERMLDEALMAQRSEQDTFVIGGLEGQLIGKCYEHALTCFWENHPNIKIKMCYYNVSELCKALVEGDVDIGIMPEAVAERLPGILFKRSLVEPCGLVMPRNHPKANKENPRLLDFRDETFLVLAESDSDSIAGRHRSVCQAAGFTPKQRIVPTYSTLVMLLEMGVGITSQNVWNSLSNIPYLKFLKMTDIGYQIEAVAWNKDNRNPNIQIFLDHVDLETQPAYDAT